MDWPDYEKDLVVALISGGIELSCILLHFFVCIHVQPTVSGGIPSYPKLGLIGLLDGLVEEMVLIWRE